MSAIVQRPGRALGLAALLYIAIFVARAMFGTVGDAISFLYVIPVVLVATSLGTRAGLAAGAVAFALSTIGGLIGDLPTTALGYVNRGLVFLFIGGLTGRFATTMRVLEAESARHFELAHDMICIADFDGRFRRVNPAFERILGYREEELLARPFIEFVHPDDRPRTEAESAALPDGNGTLRFQNRYLDSAGEVHWIEWTSAPLVDEGMIYAVARDVTERKELELELERLSHHDSLTGLYNRRRFDQEMERQLDYTQRYGKGGALLLIDLDRFKQINDELGHAAGDEALRAVADLLQRNLRRSDTLARGVVARLGGDEFAVLLPEADEAGAQVVADRIVEALATAELSHAGQPMAVAISVGVAVFEAAERPAADDILAAADRAMYTAKATGGGAAAIAPADVDGGPKPSVGLL